MKEEVKAELKVGDKVEEQEEGNFWTRILHMEKHNLEAREGVKVEDMAEAKGEVGVKAEATHLANRPEEVMHRQ